MYTRLVETDEAAARRKRSRCDDGDEEQNTQRHRERLPGERYPFRDEHHKDTSQVSLPLSKDRASTNIAAAFSGCPSFLVYPVLVKTACCTWSPNMQRRSWTAILHCRACCQAIQPLLLHGLILFHILTAALGLTL